MEKKYFLHQIKRTNGVFEKGIVVKDTFNDAKQGYHAYLGAYAYGHDTNTDFVKCSIDSTTSDTALLREMWQAKGEEPTEE